MTSTRSRIKPFIWPFLGLTALILRIIAGYFPQSTEYIYSRGIYVGIRYVWDYSLGLIPFPLYYLLITLLLFLGAKKIVRLPKKKKPFSAFLLGSLSFIGFSLFSFLFLWGFNYARIPLPKQIGIEAPSQVEDSLRIWLDRETIRLIAMRESLPIPLADSISELPDNMVATLRTSLERQLTLWNIPTAGCVQANAIAPKGVLIGLGASGIYLPWTGQGQYDASLHPVEKAVTAAHEMGHALGFTDEGVCNFLGYLACIQSDEPVLQYAGQLAVWRSLARSAYAFDTEYYHEQYGKLPKGIRADLAGIRRRRKRYKPWFPDVSRAVYDQYLKKQGVHGGMASYSRGVLLWEVFSSQ